MDYGGLQNVRKLFDIIAGTVAKLDWPPDEIGHLQRLMQLFAVRDRPKDPFGMFTQYHRLKSDFIDALHHGTPEDAEHTFLTLYCHVHGHEAPYTQAERETLNRLGGYWCHAGGISPLLKAGPHLPPHAVSVDLGAGNGLQGLLLQKLHPHRKTIQIELSSKMVMAGRHLADWLEIEPECVDWRVGDIRNYSPEHVDFIYLYRPLRPTGKGIPFYEELARNLDKATHRVSIFSIADCLGPFLSKKFHKFYDDGHLTCFENTKTSPSR